jgi:hypothetical protein
VAGLVPDHLTKSVFVLELFQYPLIRVTTEILAAIRALIVKDNLIGIDFVVDFDFFFALVTICGDCFFHDVPPMKTVYAGLFRLSTTIFNYFSLATLIPLPTERGADYAPARVPLCNLS